MSDHFTTDHAEMITARNAALHATDHAFPGYPFVLQWVNCRNILLQIEIAPPGRYSPHSAKQALSGHLLYRPIERQERQEYAAILSGSPRRYALDDQCQASPMLVISFGLYAGMRGLAGGLPQYLGAACLIGRACA